MLVKFNRGDRHVVLKRNPLSALFALADDVRECDVLRDSVKPCAFTCLSAKARECGPQSNRDFLKQILPVSFCGAVRTAQAP
jgi:hypothetical protein